MYAINIQCSPCMLLCSVSLMAKAWIGRVVKFFEAKVALYRQLNRRIWLLLCERPTFFVLDFLSNNAKLVNGSRIHSLSQYKEFIKIFKTKTEVWLQSQWFCNYYWIRTFFSSVLHWSQTKHWFVMVFEFFNWNWGDVILNFQWFHCFFLKATINQQHRSLFWVFLNCLRLICWFLRKFLVYSGVNADVEFIAIAFRRTGALLKIFLKEQILSSSNDKNFY